MRSWCVFFGVVSALHSVGCSESAPPEPQAAPTSAEAGSEGTLPFGAMADRIASALDLAPGERVLVGHDPAVLPELTRRTVEALEAAGAEVERHAFGADDDLAARLLDFDVYIWLPFGAETQADVLIRELPVTADWVEREEKRQIHFHWGDGTRAVDGMQGVHSPAYDRTYVRALDVDYDALDRHMDAAIELLRSGEVRVTTPAGTDVRFRIGDRVFTKQNGDASRDAVEGAQVRIQREIELPAGALRVAPLEDSVNGTIVVPYARLLAHPWDRPGDPADDQPPVRELRLTFTEGVLTGLEAAAGADLFRELLESSPALRHFRELAIGFNPELVTPPGEEWIPYYGYGGGVVRLSLGDNSELGGAVRGEGTRWFLFPDATVEADGVPVVRDGVLLDL